MGTLFWPLLYINIQFPLNIVPLTKRDLQFYSFTLMNVLVISATDVFNYRVFVLFYV